MPYESNASAVIRRLKTRMTNDGWGRCGGSAAIAGNSVQPKPAALNTRQPVALAATAARLCMMGEGYANAAQIAVNRGRA